MCTIRSRCVAYTTPILILESFSLHTWAHTHCPHLKHINWLTPIHVHTRPVKFCIILYVFLQIWQWREASDSIWCDAGFSIIYHTWWWAWFTQKYFCWWQKVCVPCEGACYPGCCQQVGSHGLDAYSLDFDGFAWKVMFKIHRKYPVSIMDLTCILYFTFFHILCRLESFVGLFSEFLNR